MRPAAEQRFGKRTNASQLPDCREFGLSSLFCESEFILIKKKFGIISVAHSTAVLYPAYIILAKLVNLIIQEWI